MSGNGNDGSLGAMSTTTSPVIGKIGSAMSFGGTNQQIRVGTVGGYSNNISVSAWFYHRALTGGYDEIIGADDCNNFIIYFDSSYINWSLQCGPGILIPNIYDNGWTNNGTNAFIYIDGKVVGSGSGLTPFTPGALAIGGNGVNEDGDFNGKIDDVRIYNRVLSATEVQQLYNAER